MALEKWLVAPGENRVIDVESVNRLKVGLIGGKVDIIGHDESFTRVEVHSVSGKDLRISLDGDTLEVDHPQLRWDNFIEVFASFRGSARADVSITVPRDVALKLGVVSAGALVTGLRSDVRLNTVSGDLVVDGVTGDIELNAINGEISVSNHSGDITTHTVSGDVTASGSIRRFNVDGVASNVFLDLEGSPDTVNTNTVSGNLTARVEAGLPIKYHLNTISGVLQLDDQTVKGTFGKGYESSTGVLAGSWLELHANSVSGDISIVRRLTAAADAPASAPSAAGFAAADPWASTAAESGSAGPRTTDGPDGTATEASA